MIELTQNGITITLPEQTRQAVIDHALCMFAEARTFALECVELLVNEHGARRAGIDISHFYHRRIGQQIASTLEGKPMDTPAQMVTYAINNLWPWVVGLAEATPERQTKIDAGWVEVMGE